MSLQINHYVVYGVLLPYEELKDKHAELEPYMDNAFDGVHHHDGLCCLYDGMSGEYVIIGHVVAKSIESAPGFNAPIIGIESKALLGGGDLRRKIGDLLARLGLVKYLDGRGLCWHLETIVLSHYR